MAIRHGMVDYSSKFGRWWESEARIRKEFLGLYPSLVFVNTEASSWGKGEYFRRLLQAMEIGGIRFSR